MAQVGIHDQDPVRSRGNGPGKHRASQTAGWGPALNQLNRPRLAVKQNSLAGLVRRTIVDNQNFNRERRGTLLKYSIEERLYVVRFVERGNDDGEPLHRAKSGDVERGWDRRRMDWFHFATAVDVRAIESDAHSGYANS
jgi:hypothetical protein